MTRTMPPCLRAERPWSVIGQGFRALGGEGDALVTPNTADRQGPLRGLSGGFPFYGLYDLLELCQTQGYNAEDSQRTANSEA